MLFPWKSFPVAVALLCLGAISPSLPASAQTEESQNQPTSEPLLSVEGTLEPGDATLEDGSFYDIYSFEGRAGQTVTIVLESLEFDPYLLLFDKQNEKIGENDDFSEENRNSALTMTLPEDGVYRVLASAYDAEGRGRYTLKVTPALSPQEEPIFSEAATKQVEADRLFQQGIQQYQMRQFQAALQSWEAALKIYREIGDRDREGDCLNNLGLVYEFLGQYEKAIDYYQLSLDIEREIGDRAGEGNSLGNLGNIYLSLGQYEQAIEFQQQSLAIQQEIGDRARESASLNNLGSVYKSLGQYEQAIDFLQQSLTIAREIGNRAGESTSLGNLGLVYESLEQYEQAIDFHQQSLALKREISDRAGEGNSLTNLGNIYLSLGQFEKANEFHQQSLAIAREVGDREGEGSSLNNLGVVYSSLGQYEKAIELHQQSLAIAREIGDRDGEGNSLGNLGNVYRSLGQYEKAIEFHQQSLAIKREIGDRDGEGNSLGNLGVAYDSLGQYEKALDHYQQSLAIKREISNRAGEGKSLGNLGDVYYTLGQYEQAIEFHQQSLVIQREISDRVGEGTSLMNLGNVYSSLGEYEKAIELHQQSLAIAREIGNREGEGNSLNNLGRVFYESGQLTRAEEYLLAGVEVLESIRSQSGGDENKVSIFEEQAKTYRTLQQVLIAQNKTDRALEIAERGRARALVELLTRQLNPQSQELPQIDPPSLAQIQQIAQQQNATLVQYSVIPGTALFIWVIQPTGNIEFRAVDLEKLDGSAISIDELTRLRQTLQATGRGQPEDSALTSLVRGTQTSLEEDGADIPQKLRQLHQILIEPIAEFLPSNPEDRVIFIPHESLFRVPFAALQDAEFNYLIEKHTILTAPSIQSLALTRQHRERIGNGRGAMLAPAMLAPETGNRETLIVGNPVIPDLLTQQPYNFKPLEFAEKEAQDIAKILNASPPLLGNAATETEVVKRLHSATLIHLATHGLFETDELRDRVSNLNIPGLLALTPSDGDGEIESIGDGFLTAGEIVQLTYNNPLNADLVVLSACETGLGKITGDGAIGLSRSLIAAGVPSIVVSLWKVPDNSTKELMTAFYTNLYEKKMDKAQALRQAMLTMIEESPDPGDWSGFTLIGEAE